MGGGAWERRAGGPGMEGCGGAGVEGHRGPWGALPWAVVGGGSGPPALSAPHQPPGASCAHQLGPGSERLGPVSPPLPLCSLGSRPASANARVPVGMCSLQN